MLESENVNNRRQMFFRMASVILVTIACVLVSSTLVPSCTTTNTVCFNLDDLRKMCPNIPDAATLTIVRRSLQQPGGTPPVMLIADVRTELAVPQDIRYVSGMKDYALGGDEYRKSTWKELFTHHHGRDWTPADPVPTDQQLLDWFGDKNKTKNDWIWGPDYFYPYDRVVKTERITQICFPVGSNELTEFEGWVTFPDGTKCLIEPIPAAYMLQNSTLPLALRPGCEACK